MKNIAVSILVFVAVAISSMFLIVPAWITVFPPTGKPDWPQIVPGELLGVGVGIYAAVRCHRWLRSK